jgi:phosphotriesterase-related protein
LLIQTVDGPIDADALGVTLTHEHLLIDLRCLFDGAGDRFSRSIANRPVESVRRERLEYRPYRSRDNLVIDDEDTAAAELAAFHDAGGRSLIDLTVDGLAPNPLALQRLSRRSGVHVIAGAGFYIALAHPAWVADATVPQLAARMIRAVRVGIGDTNVRAGVLGEIGTSSPLHPDEIKVLRAAAHAHRETGVPINVHCALWAREGLRILDILAAEGVDLRRVALSHMDELLDSDYHRALAERGAWLSFDTWGSEFDFGKHREPTDVERIQHLCQMLDAGWSSQILLSQDACTKLNLRRYGGKGIAHILTSVVLQLERGGLGESTIQQLLVDNPRRYLTGSAGHHRGQA